MIRIKLVQSLLGNTSISEGPGQAALVHSNIEVWETEDVQRWLTKEGYEEIGLLAKEHGITGKHLLSITPEDLKDIGIHRVGTRMDIMSKIEEKVKLVKKREASKLTIPSYFGALLQILTFAWAETSEGKAPSDQKEEIVTANLSISFVSALLTGMTFDWLISATNTCYCSTLVGDNCFCSSGFDLAGDALFIFYVLSGISAVCFLCSTILAVLQVVAINEMSDDDELSRFFDLLNESLPGKLLASGLVFCFSAIFIYIMYNIKLGLRDNSHVWYPWAMVIIYVLLVIYGFLYAMSDMIRSMYIAKVSAVRVIEGK